MTLTRWAGAVLALVAVAGLAVTCERDGDDGDGGSTSRTTGDSSVTPRRGGVLRIGVQPLTTLDPAQARTVDQVLVADHLFDGLAAYEPETLEPVPAVAQSWTETDDQREWTFTLDTSARFANGRPIVSDDVKFSLERIVRQGSGSPVADLLEPVTGYRAFAVDGTAEELAGVSAPAPETLKIAMDEPLAVLPSVLANPAFGIVPREAVEAEAPAFGEEPVGSGPWQVDERRGDTISLTPSAATDTLLDGVELVEFGDPGAAYNAFTRGDVDFVSQVPPDDVEAAREKVGDGHFTPYLAELFYGFNLRSPKFAELRFREAIVRAVDQRAIIRAVYSDTVLPLDGLLLRGTPGYRREVCGDLCAHDTEQARSLVTEAFPAGDVPEVNIDFDEEPTQQAVARAIQASLEEVGIPATLRAKPLEEYQAFAVSGDQELFRLGWIAAYPSPDAFLPPLFLTGAASNLTGFSSPDVDAQLKLARAEPGDEERLDLYQAAERTIMEQLPVVPIAQFELHAVAGERVRGLDLTAFGTFDATQVWLTADD
jgi:ABC-type transport system substrate-binding protein